MTLPSDAHSVRLAAIERQLVDLAAEVAQMRTDARAVAGEPRPAPGTPVPAPPSRQGDLSRIQAAAIQLYGRAAGGVGGRLGGGDLESFLGRYGTLLLAALVMLLAVGALVETALARGLLTPAVRVALGALASLGAALAGLAFRRRGAVRYGSALLAIALALLDLVAWGAGPRLHVVPTLVALGIVEAAAIGIAVLSIADASEFLFLVAVGGALLAPFVTSDGGGTPVVLLGFGATVLVSSMRAVRDEGWRRVFALLVGGAACYALAGSAMPAGAHPATLHAASAFAAVCAAAALFTAPRAWRGDLARCLVAVGAIGALGTWARGLASGLPEVALVSLALAAVTHAALRVRHPLPARWTASALLLPLVSLGVAYPAAEPRLGGGTVAWIWAGMGFWAWRGERARGELERGGAHLLAAGLLGAWAITEGFAAQRTAMVAALAMWGVALAWLSRDEESTLPLAAVAASAGGASLAAVAQLTERPPYAYIPFLTAASAAALAAAVGLVVSGELVGATDAVRAPLGGLERWGAPAVRRGVALAFVLAWGHLELVRAFSPDLSTALVVLYWAASGLGVLVAGRRLAAPRLRAAGLAMALGAAVGAVAEVASIGELVLRVGSYGLVGLFLLGTGWLYREGGEPGRWRLPGDAEGT